MDKDRRVHLRIYRNFILSYCEKGKEKASHEVTQVNNVSKGGINFSTTHPIKEGAVVVIDLRTPFLAASIRLEGSVLECKEKVSGMIYEIRLQFQQVGPEAMEILEKIESYTKQAEI